MASIIIGTGSKIPEKVIHNKDLERFVNTSDEWIRTRTGIVERHIAGEGETNSGLATEAARRALEMAGLSPEEIDLVIVATLTPDMQMPSVACLVQNALGAKNAGAFDLSATCSGFLYGLTIADQFIRHKPSQKILVIGSEVLSKRVNWQDRSTCVLFGDGAGAVVLTGTSEDRGIVSTHLHADGSLWELLNIKGLGTKYPVTPEILEKGYQFIEMNGREVFKHAVRALESVTMEALEGAGWRGEEIDLFVPHQANMRIIEHLRNRLGLSREKVFINIDKYGNTSAASIPIALDEANRAGLLEPGSKVLMVAFGGGFTWGSVAMKW
ncbi:3-oxoacyl-[acyl-carrier-protein] synthase, KASIII [Dissulfuribacter thermophilus]|uniref:Beta-ketoacyl-[acyl-carrier-protein] synthase III n=2 Tax=Dissulfuribacter thermophilus TaxID=1156395 RepID=A0A1B9F7M3_9BACT|nr:beta-ketoacyl-ACP synthase III [Dissulfuribacter thermophilus]OCC15916.1 3-oxoacyl-[acyl-carrier-protein] synthase, KASIII [Dissulfuribacter thermophilus]